MVAHSLAYIHIYYICNFCLVGADPYMRSPVTWCEILWRENDTRNSTYNFKLCYLDSKLLVCIHALWSARASHSAYPATSNQQHICILNTYNNLISRYKSFLPGLWMSVTASKFHFIFIMCVVRYEWSWYVRRAHICCVVLCHHGHERHITCTNVRTPWRVLSNS